MSEELEEERFMLISISDDCTTLEMDDGSRWGVEPGYNPTIATWLPTESISIRLVGPDSPWPYELTNIGEGVSVRARQE